MPPLNALRAFEAAAGTSSFKSAATELDVAQSAVSHRIAHLEEYLQSLLFVRRLTISKTPLVDRTTYIVGTDNFAGLDSRAPSDARETTARQAHR